MRPPLIAGVALALSACARGPRPIEQVPTVPVQIAVDGPISCEELAARVIANRLLEVDQAPAPLAYDPPAIKLPVPNYVAKNRKPNVAVEVMIDTLGRADMKTFSVVRSTHKYYADHLRMAVSQWRFTPAMLGPCKVPSVYRFAMSGELPDPTRAKKPENR